MYEQDITIERLAVNIKKVRSEIRCLFLIFCLSVLRIAEYFYEYSYEWNRREDVKQISRGMQWPSIKMQQHVQFLLSVRQLFYKSDSQLNGHCNTLVRITTQLLTPFTRCDQKITVIFKCRCKSRYILQPANGRFLVRDYLIG